ncbi:hypothetical protein LF817_07530 [Halobacillus sp. A1]|uniref:MotE family protein n=1 Tax=Halobacillus sp. A1 TaxID=2880262 RepID=UPI0020A6D3C4|nr:hypothetical protein [Halobacillus sp. A1]MCP3031196.1 hypothetical protein [Halobacillus sp. A1]
MEKSREKSQNRFQWFFLVIVVPTIFALTIMLIVMSMMGINVLDKGEEFANKIPGVSSLVTTQSEENEQRTTDHYESAIADYQAEIEQLEGDNSSKDATIDELNQTIIKLEANLESASDAAETSDEETGTDDISEMAKSFQEMDEEAAAPILENMEGALAVSLLSEMQSDVRGAVLGEMSPEAAAQLTSLMTEEQ